MYIPAEEFYYEHNPYDRDLLTHKEAQVHFEIEHMETNKKKLMSAALASNARAHASDDDVDPLQNSNLKWFESAIANIQVVENMTKQLHEQERAG